FGAFRVAQDLLGLIARDTLDGLRKSVDASPNFPANTHFIEKDPAHRTDLLPEVRCCRPGRLVRIGLDQHANAPVLIDRSRIHEIHYAAKGALRYARPAAELERWPAFELQTNLPPFGQKRRVVAVDEELDGSRFRLRNKDSELFASFDDA